MVDSMYTELGAAIRKRRDEIGMTQATLASKLGLSRTSVTNIERGRQPMLVHQLLHTSDVLGVDVTELLKSTKPQQASIEHEMPAEFKLLFAKLKPTKERTS